MADKSIREIIEAALKRIKIFRKTNGVPTETATVPAIETAVVSGMSEIRLKEIIEAALMAAGKPLSIEQIIKLFLEDERPERADVRRAMESLTRDYAHRPVELLETAAGFRLNVRSEYATWVSRLWEERPPRYSRALLETLSLVAYRQPITRGEIEDVRGVSVSSNIIKTLMERGWVKEVGHRDVPGKPALLATTKEFLNYFGLMSLDDLPTLAEIKDLDSINGELNFEDSEDVDDSQDGEASIEDEIAEPSGAEIIKLEISADHVETADDDYDDQDVTVTEPASGEQDEEGR